MLDSSTSRRSPTDADPMQHQARRLRIWALVVLVPVAVIGAALSFQSLYRAAEPVFGAQLALGFPLLVDFLILGASLQYVAGAKTGQPRAGWRWTAHAGVIGTLTLNAMAARTLHEVPWHITAPAVWSVLVELTAREVLGEWRATHAPLADKIPLRLWLTAPLESARTWLRIARRVEGEQAAARLDVGVHAAAVAALKLALPQRRARRVRRILVRQLRAGSLPPAAILGPLGWIDGTAGLSDVTPQAVLRAALRDTLRARGGELPQPAALTGGADAAGAAPSIGAVPGGPVATGPLPVGADGAGRTWPGPADPFPDEPPFAAPNGYPATNGYAAGYPVVNGYAPANGYAPPNGYAPANGYPAAFEPDLAVHPVPTDVAQAVAQVVTRAVAEAVTQVATAVPPVPSPSTVPLSVTDREPTPTPVPTAVRPEPLAPRGPDVIDLTDRAAFVPARTAPTQAPASAVRSSPDRSAAPARTATRPTPARPAPERVAPAAPDVASPATGSLPLAERPVSGRRPVPPITLGRTREPEPEPEETGPSSDVASTGDRFGDAVEIVRVSESISPAQLATQLRSLGWTLSDRTAGRVLSEVREHLLQTDPWALPTP